MSNVIYKCPACGAALHYEGTTGKLTCPSCGSEFDANEMEALNLEQEGGDVSFRTQAATFSEQNAAGLDAYNCQMCGAALMCESTTTATECPYCGSPIIVADHLLGGVKPDQVVPFTISKEEATQKFHDYFKGQRLLSKAFTKGDNTIKELRKLYVPYWLFDCDAYADVVYDAEKRQVTRQGEYEITKVDHYVVRRTGTLSFDRIPVDGSQKMNEQIAESLEPYDLSGAIPFQSAVLSGALADHADISAEDCAPRAKQRVEQSTQQAMRDTVTGYSSVSVRKQYLTSQNGTATPVLLPVWMMTTEKDTKEGPKTYTFAVNGQTGRLTCDLKADKGLMALWMLCVSVLVFGLCCVLLALTHSLSSSTMVTAAIIALLIGGVVVSVFNSKLKTARNQFTAGHYVRDDSLHLSRRLDRFTHTTTTKRKIENK